MKGSLSITNWQVLECSLIPSLPISLPFIFCIQIKDRNINSLTTLLLLKFCDGFFHHIRFQVTWRNFQLVKLKIHSCCFRNKATTLNLICWGVECYQDIHGNENLNPMWHKFSQEKLSFHGYSRPIWSCFWSEWNDKSWFQWALDQTLFVMI